MDRTIFAAAVLCGATPLSAVAAPIPVEVVQTDDGWVLHRDGEPYLIQGAGGSGPLDQLAALGANSVRTWGVDETTGPLLDRAHELGLTVTVGIWLGHERHGFDYGDPAQVAAQLEAARAAVLAHKDHPALLMWGVGNEMEGFKEGDNPAIWRAVNDVADMVQELDPAHPTMTVTAEIGGERVASVRDLCPAVDVHGINAYGGAASIATRYRAQGGTKPYLLTEFGPPGAWETGETPWGAPFEGTSTEKASAYRRTWTDAVVGAPGLSLGGYAFTWGYKMEATATWFGLLLPTGDTVNAVDTLAELWTGEPPADRSPRVSPIEIAGSAQRDPGDVIEVRWTVDDPEGAPVTVEWALRRESGEYLTGGDARPMLPDLPGAVVSSTTQTARIRLPDFPGPYRLFAAARDGTGHAATANLPLLVRGEPRTPLPLAVYSDGFEGSPWAPSGWMGNTDDLAVNGAHEQGCHRGKCIEVAYRAPDRWAGIAWQNPANNWGDHDGGLDLSGAKALEFYARGAAGGEHVSVGVGLLDDSNAHPDSTIVKKEGIVLTDEWKRYRIPLRRKDLTSLKTGFVVTFSGGGSDKVFYLDEVWFVR